MGKTEGREGSKRAIFLVDMVLLCYPGYGFLRRKGEWKKGGMKRG